MLTVLPLTWKSRRQYFILLESHVDTTSSYLEVMLTVLPLVELEEDSVLELSEALGADEAACVEQVSVGVDRLPRVLQGRSGFTSLHTLVFFKDYILFNFSCISVLINFVNFFVNFLFSILFSFYNF